ncbi:FecR family protein [Chitinophaga nivalis]|uniref:DUF4974 domain-containing protein n=1 Tax=Chitinophaga nivalis TaxID=2991709 RepID=A0ABT3IRC3_9BACT|nr:FecR family protein [Chitinophaga nivalis]MCW3463778.1 DUF4974 domain-containing protein [Chitinophaga nivalis]MCW3486532.1 DUF4974 domain-containing protein [Chitinophaga nivalis]
MLQQKEADQALLQQYLEGSYTQEQLKQIQVYLTDPAYRDSMAVFLEKQWLELPAAPITVTPALQQRYQQFLVKTNETTVVRRLWSGWRRVAAVAAVLLLSGYSGYRWYNGQLKTGKVAGQWTWLKNPPGKRSRILLPDSSVVYLSGGSSLRYPAGYGNSHRQLFLEGEAYFMVKHDTTKPFSVTTGQVTTVDVGTAFNIRSLKDQPEICIAVAEGVVNVSDTKGEVGSLTRLQQLRYHVQTGSHKTTLVDNEAQIGSWREGVLLFRKQSLGEVATELERYYGVSIRFAQPALAHVLITTTLKNVSLPEALDILSLTAAVQCKQEGNTVTIRTVR